MNKLIPFFLLILLLILSSCALFLNSDSDKKEIPREGLIAYWSFDDSTAADKSGNDHDLQLFGPTLQKGIKGNALEFDGENDFAEISHSSMFNSNAKTISFWFFKSNDTIKDTPNKSDFEGLIWKAFDTTQQRPFSFLLINQSLPFRVAFQLGNNESDFFRSNAEAIVHQQWYHVVGVSDETKILLYINGTLESSLQFKGTIVQNNSHIVLGKASVITDPTRYFNGKIDELLFYNRVLTEEEIQTLYQIARL